MKFVIIFLFSSFASSVFASTKPDFAFSCQTINRHEFLRMDVELFIPKNQHPQGGLIDVFGKMLVIDLKDKNFIHILDVQARPQYDEFSLTGANEKYKFRLDSDTRTLEGKNKIAGKLTITPTDFVFQKGIEFSVVCDGKKE